MNHKIAEPLLSLAQPVDKLVHLPGNSWKGHVEAIAKSFERFGQVKPLVGVENEDGTITIVAGNHSLKAAKTLGWTHVAVSVTTFKEGEDLAFALTDNRIPELGEWDDRALLEVLENQVSHDPDFFEVLGWDDFEIAAMEESALLEDSIPESITIPGGGFIPPTIVNPDKFFRSEEEEDDENDGSEKREIEWHSGDEEAREIATRGATTVGIDERRKVVQNTIVWDDVDQQQEWYRFLKWLKARYPGGTTAEQLITFLRKDTNYLTD